MIGKGHHIKSGSINHAVVFFFPWLVASSRLQTSARKDFENGGWLQQGGKSDPTEYPLLLRVNPNLRANSKLGIQPFQQHYLDVFLDGGLANLTLRWACKRHLGWTEWALVVVVGTTVLFSKSPVSRLETRYGRYFEYGR